MKLPVLNLLAGLGLTLACSSCGSFFQKDVVPPAGTMTAVDNEAQQLYQQGEEAIARGKDRTARKAFQEIIKDHPLSAVAAPSYMRLGELYENHKEPLDAFESYSDLSTKYPNSDLYSEALRRQERLAFAAVDGDLKNNFLGLKSRMSASRCAKMLETVASNAPETDTAAKARFRIGELFENREETQKARQAFVKVIDQHPYSQYAPEAQFRIGDLLMKDATGGNQDRSNLNAARDAFTDYLQRYPNGKRAKEARQKIGLLRGEDVGRSFEIAEFYRKKKQNSSAIFYYREVLKAKGNNPYRQQAIDALTALGAKP